MTVFQRWFFLLALLGWAAENSASSETLQSVQILFRHGNRERDPGYNQPSGQLLPSGKKQMYELGLFFRQRYNGFIKTSYDGNEISILSSDAVRTIMSASLVGYGVYKDFNMAASWDGEGNIHYEPIPVRTIPKKYDKYLQIFSDCPRQTELDDESAQTYGDRFGKENRDLIDYYNKTAGDQTFLDASKGRVEQFTEMAYQSEMLAKNISKNLPIADWAEPLKNNFAFLSIKTGLHREEVNTLEKKRLKAGPLIGLLLKNMEEPSATRKKMFLFSGHDRIFAFLMVALGIDDPSVSNVGRTGNSLLFELHEDPQFDSGPFVQFLVRNDTRDDPFVLEMPNCGNPCYLSTFVKLTKELISTDLEFESECAASIKTNLKSQATGSYLNQWNVSFFSSFIIFALAVIVVFQIILIKRRNYTKLG